MTMGEALALGMALFGNNGPQRCPLADVTGAFTVDNGFEFVGTAEEGT